MKIALLTKTCDAAALLLRLESEGHSTKMCVLDPSAARSQVFRGLVQPTQSEQALNGFKLRKGRQIDWKEQFERAVEAFQRKQIRH